MQNSYVALGVALVLAPLIMTAILTGAAFMIAGMSEPTRDAVMRVTRESGIAMLALNYGFTLTFGLFGVIGLLMLEQRGAVVWAIAGGLLGALSGLLFGMFFMDGIDRVLLLSFGLGGWAIFILVRWLAGIRIDRPEADD